MKKIAIMLMICMIFVFPACSQEDSTGSSYEDIDYTGYRVYEGFDDIEKRIVRTETEAVVKTADFENTLVIGYDGKGREISRRFYMDKDDEQPLTVSYYRYNSDGSCVEKVVSSADVYTFNIRDAQQNITEWYDYKIINDEYVLNRYSTIEYSGNMVSNQVVYSASDEEISRLERYIDEEGNTITKLYDNGVLSSENITSEENHIYENTYYNADGSINRIEKADYENGKMTGLTVYDANGNVIQKSAY